MTDDKVTSNDKVTAVSAEQFEQLLADSTTPGVPNEALRAAAAQARRQIVRRAADIPEEFDGCARACRQPLVHTLVWGECAHAPESARPEPRVSIGGVFIDVDGYPSIGMTSIPVSELAARIERVLRSVPVQIPDGDYAGMAYAVAMDLAEEPK